MAEPQDEMSRVAWIHQSLREAARHSAQWRKDARDAYDFRAGKQWAQDDIAAMERQGKVPIVFNRIERTVRAVVGMEIQNRQEVRFSPRGVEDSGISELYTAAADWIRDNCNAEDEESEAFQDLLTTGMGWTDTDLDYEENRDGKVIINRDDPLDMFWDPSSRKKNLMDRRWNAQIKRVSYADIKSGWPQFESLSPQSSSQQFLDDEDKPTDATPPRYEDNNHKASAPRMKELIRFQWWERETFHRIVTPEGQEIELSPVKWNTMRPQLEAMGVQHVEQKRRVYYEAYVVDGTLLEEKKLAVQSGFTYKCMTGARDRNANTWFGLVGLMLDPQRFANKWLSQITHILNKSAKGGLIAETDAFSNPKIAEDTWAKAETITWASPGAVGGNKIMPKPETPFPEGYGRLLEFAIQSINDVPGVSVEFLGLTGANQPGVLEEMRKKAGVTILAVFFDSIRLYRKEQGRLMVEYIRDYLSDGRLIRIAGEDSAKYVPLLRDPRTLEFDVVAEESPTSPNNKERTFALLSQLAPTLTQAGVPLPPAILEYSPLPTALVEKWKEHIKNANQIPENLKPAIEQMQQTMQAQQAEIGKLAADKLKLETDNTLELYKVQQQAKTDREVSMIKAAAENEVAQIKAQTEAQKRGVEVYEANLKAMIDRMQMVADAVAEHAKQQTEARPQMLVTEQAAGGLSQALLPALAQMMEISTAQMEQLKGMPQHFENAMMMMAEKMAQSMADSISGARVVSAEKVIDPNTGRVVAVRRKFKSGDEDMLPFQSGSSMMQ